MTTNTLSLRRSPLADLGGALSRAFVHLAQNSPGARCAAEAERLFALSDAELEAEGLSRDRVIRHAFGWRIAL